MMPSIAIVASSRLTLGGALAVVLLVLGGCAYSPGNLFGPTLDQVPVAKPNPQMASNQALVVQPSGSATTLSRLFGGKGNAAAGTGALQIEQGLPDPPPPGVLRSITSELVRSQQVAARQADPLVNLRPFFGEAVGLPHWRRRHRQRGRLGAGRNWHSPLRPPRQERRTPAAFSNVGNGYNVSPEGAIQFPLIGSIRIVGLTEEQARAAITQSLARFIRDPQVTVRLQAYRAGRVYVDGEVRTPGQLAINDIPMTLPEALSRAGGLTTNADRASVLLSRGDNLVNVNLTELAARGVNPGRILLKAGDLVRVAHRDDSRVYVLGEVLAPRALSLRNGRLSLNEALGEVGGINPGSADPRQVFVIRAKPAGATGAAGSKAADLPEIYHLDARSPMGYALAEGFELKPRDVVFVDPVPLVRWNRVISLILPSAQALSTTKSIVTN
jgi:polysaccharide export outer membrane protein